jgi:hypothetical protein
MRVGKALEHIGGKKSLMSQRTAKVEYYIVHNRFAGRDHLWQKTKLSEMSAFISF